MNSLDSILTNMAPELPRETSLVNPVMAQIKHRQVERQRLISRSLLGCLVLALITLVGTMIRGNSGKVITLAAHKLSSIPAHPGLYARALLETLPWPTIAIVAALALAVRLMQRNQFKFARHATSALAVSIGALALTAGASAATITTTSAQPGPVQQELQRTVNGIGKQEVTVDGKTYELAAGQFYTDKELHARAELDRLGDFKKTLDLPKALDTGYVDYLAYVTATDGNTLTLVDPPGHFNVGQSPETPAVMILDSQTIYLNGSAVTSRIDFKVGDLVDIGIAKNLKSAAFVAKMTYSFIDYSMAEQVGASSVSSARRTDGKCYNNEADSCPNLPAVHDIVSLNSSQTVPSDGVVREAFGQLVSYGTATFKIKTSSGTVWTFSDFGSITAINQSGYVYTNYNDGSSQADHSLQIKPGDYIRVEFWQHKNELDKREVINQGFSGTKDQARQLAAEGKLELHPEFYIRSIQLALKQPWYAGEQPVKFTPIK